MNPTNKSTGILAVGTTNINNGKAIVAGLSLTAAAADVTVTLYDENSATGTEIAKYVLLVANKSDYIDIPDVRCDTGLTAVVAGVGAEVIVHYR